MHPADIKASLQKAGFPSKRVAGELNVPESTVSEVIHSKSTSRRVAERIAEIIGVPIGTIWPGKYKTRRRRALRQAEPSAAEMRG